MKGICIKKKKVRYFFLNYYAVNTNEETLQHYGVLGMKWGVIRWRKNLESAHKKGNVDKAVKSVEKLQKHKSKIEKKISKYDKELLELKEEATKNQDKRKKISKYEYKVAKNNLKSARTDNESKQEKLANKNVRLNAKIATLENEIKETELAISDLEITKSLYSDYLSMADESLSTTGKDYVRALTIAENAENFDEVHDNDSNVEQMAMSIYLERWADENTR